MTSIKRTGIAFLLLMALLSSACGPQNVHDLKVDLNKAAKTLNTAAKLNHNLAVAGTISIETRRKAAKIIHAANDELLIALDIAKDLTDANFASDKARIATILHAISTTLSSSSTGNAEIDALLQAAVLALNSALALTASLDKPNVIPYLPEIHEWAEGLKSTCRQTSEVL